MSIGSITRRTLAALCLFAAPLLYAGHGPAEAPPLGTERFVVYFSCASGTPQYTGFEQWECDGDFYNGGNTGTNFATVNDTNCDTWIGEDPVYWCRTPRGIWYETSEAAFNTCHPCFDIGN